MFRRIVVATALMSLGASTMLADFSYQETSTITGGMIAGMMKMAAVFSKAAREPAKSTISVKGDKMMHRSSTHASIIDINAQTITSIDLQKKTYSVMTFEEMKKALDDMAQKMKEKQKDGQAEMAFKVSANATGNTKTIDGMDTKEMIVKMEMEGTDKKSGQTGGMAIVMDSWLAAGVPGYQEVRKFQERMAQKLSWTPGGSMFMQRPDVAKGMAEASKEMAKMDGIPVYQTMVMNAAGQPAADGSAPPPPQQQQQPQQQVERPSVGGALGGALGGKFGLGRKKTPPANNDAGNSAPAQGGSQNAGSLLEMTIQLSTFSSAPLADSDFAVPAGFKQVEPEMKRAAR
jgi:hypothetical protein